ncbi:hypothetical protein AAY473_016091 [Plecturocebus cupreus]
MWAMIQQVQVWSECTGVRLCRKAFPLPGPQVHGSGVNSAPSPQQGTVAKDAVNSLHKQRLQRSRQITWNQEFEISLINRESKVEDAYALGRTHEYESYQVFDPTSPTTLTQPKATNEYNSYQVFDPTSPTTLTQPKATNEPTNGVTPNSESQQTHMRLLQCQLVKNLSQGPGTVAHACDPSTLGSQGGSSEEAQARESLEPGRRKLQGAKITPLHSSLGDTARRFYLARAMYLIDIQGCREGSFLKGRKPALPHPPALFCCSSSKTHTLTCGCSSLNDVRELEGAGAFASQRPDPPARLGGKIIQPSQCRTTGSSRLKHFGRPRQEDHLRLGVQDQTGQHGEILPLLKLQKLAGRVGDSSSGSKCTYYGPGPSAQSIDSAGKFPQDSRDLAQAVHQHPAENHSNSSREAALQSNTHRSSSHRPARRASDPRASGSLAFRSALEQYALSKRFHTMRGYCSAHDNARQGGDLRPERPDPEVLPADLGAGDRLQDGGCNGQAQCTWKHQTAPNELKLKVRAGAAEERLKAVATASRR